MAYDQDEYRAYERSVERYKNSKTDPGTFGFDDLGTLKGVRDALSVALESPAPDEESRKPVLLVKRGLDRDGRHDAWILVKRGDELLYVGNVAYTCPPRPPEDCE